MDNKDKHIVPLGTLYEFNKQLMLKQNELTKSQIKQVIP